MSDAEIKNKNDWKVHSIISDPRFNKKSVLIAFLLSFFAAFSVDSAIRIVGPQATPLLLSDSRVSTVNDPLFLGPTGNGETLWSISSKYTPKNASLTIYQTIGAIFRLNPKAFRNNNIHDLIPGSILVMPTQTEIRQESTEDVAQRLLLDRSRKNAGTKSKISPLSKSAPLASKASVSPAPKKQDAPMSAVNKDPDLKAPDLKKESALESEMMAESENKSKENQADKSNLKTNETLKRDMRPVQTQIDASEVQMGKLFESNHIMKIRLAEIKHEILGLKEQIKADDGLTKEIKVFLDAQRLRQEQIKVKDPSFFSSLMDSPLMLIIMTIIPALLLIGGAAFFILFRKKEEIIDKAPEKIHDAIPEDMPVITLPDDDDDDDELILEDSDLEGNENLGNLEKQDEINLSDPLELSQEPEESGFENMLDLNDPLENDLDTAIDEQLDPNPSMESEIEMGENLETGEKEPELSPDEALAAMWEQSLNADNPDVDDIDALLAAEQDPKEIPEDTASSEILESQANDALQDDALKDDVLPEDDAPDQGEEAFDIDEIINAKKSNDVDEPPSSLDDANQIEPEEEINLAGTDVLLDELLSDDEADDDIHLSVEDTDEDVLLADTLLSSDLDETQPLPDFNAEDAEPEDAPEVKAEEAEAEAEEAPEAKAEEAETEEAPEDKAEESEDAPEVKAEEAEPEEAAELKEEDAPEVKAEDAEPEEAPELKEEAEPEEAPEAKAEEAEPEEVPEIKADNVELEDPEETETETEEAPEVKEEEQEKEDPLEVKQEEALPEETAEIQSDKSDIENIDDAAISLELDAKLQDELETELLEDDEAAALDALFKEDFVEPATTASENDLDLLDELLDQEQDEVLDKEQERQNAKEETALSPEDSDASATQDDLDFLDTLLDGSDEAVNESIDETRDKLEDEAKDETTDDAPLDLLSLPEYDEQAVLDGGDYDPEIIPYEDIKAYDHDDESLLNLEDFPEYTEEDAASDANVTLPEGVPSHEKTDDTALDPQEKEEKKEEQKKEEKGKEKNAKDDFSATQLSTLTFPSVDPIGLDELGEFDEDDALDAALAEQRELDESIPAHHDFQQKNPPISQAYQHIDFSDFNDYDDEAYQIAGLDMDALLSESMDEDASTLPEFDIDELEIPEDETSIWAAQKTPEPTLENEDWFHQPEISDDDIEKMAANADLEGLLEEGQSELVDASSSDDGYISIETLLKDDGVPQEDPDSLKLDLDVGLDDFPDVLEDVIPTDVDAQGESAAHMDLAKAYLEMNDIDGAIELLEKVMQGNDEGLKEEARRMIENIH